jgi:hypothetical protein
MVINRIWRQFSNHGQTVALPAVTVFLSSDISIQELGPPGIRDPKFIVIASVDVIEKSVV